MKEIIRVLIHNFKTLVKRVRIQHKMIELDMDMQLTYMTYADFKKDYDPLVIELNKLSYEKIRRK